MNRTARESAVTNSLELPDPDFIAGVVNNLKGYRLRHCRALWAEIAELDPVLAKTPLAACDWGHLFAYMHRRFGPPNMAGDPHKDLSAGWILASPDPDVFVAIRPFPADACCSFEPYLRVEPGIFGLSRGSLTSTRRAAVAAAYRAVLLDLLRPVAVRDTYINALGELGESPLDQALTGDDEDRDDDRPEDNGFSFEAHPDAGTPMPAGLFGGADWSAFCALIAWAGDGDVGRGRQALQARLRAEFLETVRNRDIGFRRVVYAMADPARRDLAAQLGLGDAEVNDLDEKLAALRSGDTDILDLLAAADAAVLEEATSCLIRLGVICAITIEDVTRFRTLRACRAAQAELRALPGAPFPAGILDTDLFFEPAPITTIRSRLIDHGRPDLVAWIDAVAGRDNGLAVLHKVLMPMALRTDPAPEL